MEEVDWRMLSKNAGFGGILSTARVLLGAVRGRSDRGWRSDDLLVPCFQTQGQALPISTRRLKT